MHECTLPFFLTKGNREAAKKYEFFYRCFHCEPMVWCSTAWRVETKREGAYDYVNNTRLFTNSGNIKKRWWSGILIYVGYAWYTMARCRSEDGEEQKAVIDRVFADQRGLIEKYVDKDVTKVPQVLVLIKRYLHIYHAGITGARWCNIDGVTIWLYPPFSYGQECT